MWLLPIAAVVAALGGAFAYTGGWLSPARVTPDRMVDALAQRGGNPVGHRRNHSKGVCFTGSFIANGAGQAVSRATVFAPGQYPVVGRFAIGTGNPAAPDSTGRVRSMAVQIATPDGQQWRSGMNAMPFFPFATPDVFYQATVAARVNPATGKPDPAAMARFGALHPEAAPFNAWAKTAPWTGSYTDLAYNSLDAFIMADGQGARHAVRWSMQPETPEQDVPLDQLAQRGPNFLQDDLMQRVAQTPPRWHLLIALADAGDSVNDPSKPWPATRKTIDAGTLQIAAAQDEDHGPCRDINYDPLVLPDGIARSDDPILTARSAAYANSFDRREAEVGQ